MIKEAITKELFKSYMEKNNCLATKAAKEMGYTRTYVYQLLYKYNLKITTKKTLVDRF